MLKFFETKSSLLSESTFLDKFKGKKILAMGSGPSVNEVNWEKIDYDSLVTTSFFYLNDKIRNLPNITHITLSDLVDLEHPNLIEFLETNPECTVAFEPKSHPFYNSTKYLNFNKKYKERIVYYNTSYGKKEGVAGRICYFTIQFSPSDLYYVGIDGESANSKLDPINAFRTEIRGNADGYPQSDFVESHLYFANILHKASLQTKTKLYNLGEGLSYNCSTPYSQEHFPLPDNIKKQLKNG